MKQHLGVEHLDNQYRNAAPRAEDRIMAFKTRAICLGDEDGISYPSYQDLVIACEEQGAEIPTCQYLFSINETAFFLVELGDTPIKGYHFHSLFEFRTLRPLSLLMAGYTAWHLHTWYQTNQFCGVCGTILNHDEEERMLKCPNCGNMVYPRIAPAVMVGVTHGTRILMTKYAGREYKNNALIAGFTEIGETAEQTVVREVAEEVGLRVKNVTYYKSQPWGLTGLLLMGFFAEVEDLEEIKLDEKELAEANWVDAADIEYDEAPSMLMGDMVQHFRARVIQALNNKNSWKTVR